MLGTLKIYSNCYKIIYHFKPHSPHICQHLFPHISFLLHINLQVVISTSRIFETIFYCSVTSYSLSVDQSLLDNNFVSSKNDTDFAWYSKCGGGNSVLKVILRLKDDKGHIFNTSLTPLDINTKLVYDYVYATYFMYLSPLKE